MEAVSNVQDSGVIEFDDLVALVADRDGQGSKTQVCGLRWRLADDRHNIARFVGWSRSDLSTAGTAAELPHLILRAWEYGGRLAWRAFKGDDGGIEFEVTVAPHRVAMISWDHQIKTIFEASPAAMQKPTGIMSAMRYQLKPAREDLV